MLLSREPGWLHRAMPLFAANNRNLGVNRTTISYEPQARFGVPTRRRGRIDHEAETNKVFWVPAKADWTDLDAQVRKASNIVEEVRTVLSRPGLSVDIDYTKSPENIRLPDYEVTRRPQIGFALATLSEIHSRNLVAATRDIVSISRMTQVGKDELLIISQILRWQAGLTGLGVTWEALQRNGWTDEQLLALQHAGQESSVIESTSSILEMERLLYSQLFQTESVCSPRGQSLEAVLFTIHEVERLPRI